MSAIMGGIGVKAQRPVGDTLAVGHGDYLYDTCHVEGSYFPNITVGQPGRAIYDSVTGEWYSPYVDGLYVWYRLMMVQGRITSSQIDLSIYTPDSIYGFGYFEQLLHDYPNLSLRNAGPHITGQEFPVSEDLRVIGLAVCPQIRTDPEHLSLDDSRIHMAVIDTTLAGRVDEYVQLYTVVDDTTLQLRAEGPWRWDDAHRYMYFPSQYLYLDTLHPGYEIRVDSAKYAPLYEVMFDTVVPIEGSKQSFVVAGTYNNNWVRWCDTCSDELIFPEPWLCFEHPFTSYTVSRGSLDGLPIWSVGYRPYWCKVETFPWVKIPSSYIGKKEVVNIFPILDTLWGTPLMWSADGRQHHWELHYFPTDDTGNGRVLTLPEPHATLRGLVPGAEYGAVVRGLCDEENYSPWGDTLLFVMPHDTTQASDTTHTQGIRLGNLDLFTRIMPNPAQEVVNVMSSYRLESVAVYDLAGRQVLEQPAEGISAIVNVSTLPRGTYIMAIRTQQGVATKKLLVE